MILFAWIRLPEKRKDNRPKTPEKQERLNYYLSTTWRRLRQQKVKESPLCERCLAQGRVEPMREVHHLVKWFQFKNEETRLRMFTDYENLYSVCTKCHRYLDTEGIAESIEIYNKRKLDATNEGS